MKLELYKPYKTREGYKAVTIKQMDDKAMMCMIFLNKEQPKLTYSNIDGGENRYGYDEFDIVAPWVESKSGEFWVNVYEDYFSLAYLTKETAENGKDYNRIALKRVVWTEGDEE